VFLEDYEIDFPDPLDAATRRRSIHRFADQSVRLSLGSAFASPACFFQIDHHRDHAQVEAGGGFARLPHDAFSCPIFNRLRNFGDIEQSGIISTPPPRPPVRTPDNAHTWAPHASGSGRDDPKPLGSGRHGPAGRHSACRPPSVSLWFASLCYSHRLKAVYYCCDCSWRGGLATLAGLHLASPTAGQARPPQGPSHGTKP